MAGVAAAIGGSALLGFAGSQSAAGKMAGAADAATALQREQFNYQKAMNEPYQEAGTKALTGMQNDKFQKGFSMEDFNTSPGYQFSLQQGQDALNAANAASGNQVSGAGMAALSKYNVGMANQEYQQAFNNYNTTQNLQYGRLATLAAGGAGANAAMGQASQGYANSAGNNMMSGAQAQAAGQMAGMNSIGGAMTGLAQYYGQNKGSASPTQPDYGQHMAGGPEDNIGSGYAGNASNFALMG